MSSKITNDYKKLKNIFMLISLVLWLGTTAFLVIYGVSTQTIPLIFNPAENSSPAMQLILKYVLPLVVTFGGGLLLFIFIKQKIRNTVWIINLILAVLIFEKTGMWVIAGIFALDEIIIRPLYKHFKEKYSINTEIDKRV